MKKDHLQRFLEAQQTDYQTALNEIKNGKKNTHWMWYIFPQIKGLGFSETSRYYSISDKSEAEAYLKHPVLGQRLTSICYVLLTLWETDAHRIFGSPDDMKLRSCLTLFSSLPDADPVFGELLQKFFNGVPDQRTLDLLNNTALSDEN